MEKRKKNALVTGASGGLGLEFARQLALLDYNVILVSRNREKLSKVKEELESAYRITASVMPCDLTKPGAAQSLLADFKESGIGSLDVLVNNAGAGTCGENIYQDPVEVNKLITLNITAFTELCMLFGRFMAEQGRGYILNVGSLAGRNAIPYFAVYTASKWYVLCYSIALARELKERGVSLTCIQPGFIRTEFDANAGIGSEKYKQMSYKTGLEPELVARVGLRALFKRKTLVTPGFGNKITVFFTGLLPKTLTAWVMKGYLDNLLK